MTLREALAYEWLRAKAFVGNEDAEEELAWMEFAAVFLNRSTASSEGVLE